MKYISILFICFSLIAIALTGCDRSSSIPDKDISPSTEEISAFSDSPPVFEGERSDVLVWLYAADSMEYYINDSFYERIEKALPQYNVEVKIITGTGEDMEKQYLLSKEQGIIPDAMYIILSTFSNFGTKGEWLLLDDYIKKWEGHDDIMSAGLAMGKLSQGYAGIGSTPAPSVFVYRTDYFKEAGLDPLNPPSNWQELKEYAIKLTKRKEDGQLLVAGLDIPTTDNYGNFSFPFMRMNDASIVDEISQQPDFMASEVIETLEYLYDLSSQNLSFSYNWQDADNIPFLKGKSAMSFINLDLYIRLMKEHPELKDKVRIGLPLGNELVTSFCGYRMMTIPSLADNPDGGWEVIKFIMSKEEMQLRVEEYGVIPVRKSLMSIYEAKNPEIGRSVMETVSVGKGAFLVPWISTLYQYYGPAYEAVMGGEKTPREAMQEVQTGILNEITP